MIMFTSIDLQKRTGDVQRAASREPVLVTSHGKPRNVFLSAEEFGRLKAAAGEPVPDELRHGYRQVVRLMDDVLGYDVSDIGTAARQMAEDEERGHGAKEVQSELDSIRSRYARR